MEGRQPGLSKCLGRSHRLAFAFSDYPPGMLLPRNLPGFLPPHLHSNKDFPDPLLKILPHAGAPPFPFPEFFFPRASQHPLTSDVGFCIFFPLSVLCLFPSCPQLECQLQEGRKFVFSKFFLPGTESSWHTVDTFVEGRKGESLFSAPRSHPLFCASLGHKVTDQR